MATIGLDYGSSYSTVSWINPKTNMAEAVRFNGDGSVKMPSVMLATNEGFVTGYEAADYLEELNKISFEQRFELIGNFILNLKRDLNPEAIGVYYDQEYTHQKLLEIFLRNLIEQVQLHCGDDYHIDNIILSHPVDFTSSKIDIIKGALENLGLVVEETIPEPIAAAYGYELTHKVENNETILVFDFGGGTIDVACVQKNINAFDIISQPKGSSNCGGQDIDYLIYDFFRKEILQKHNSDISINGNIDNTILIYCRRLKEHFSGVKNSYDAKGMVQINNELKYYSFGLSREQFNDIIYPKVYEAVKVAERVITDVNNKNQTIDKVLLIGGSSKLTLVKDLISQLLPNAKIVTCGEQDIAVALGNIYYVIQENNNSKENDVVQDDNSFNEPLNLQKHMSCKQCQSERCFKLQNRRGYHCLNCGWEGLNITVIYE